MQIWLIDLLIHVFGQMVDANQKWEVQEAIDWMKQLAPYKPLWIEEPTNPDDIMGHAAIAEVNTHVLLQLDIKSWNLYASKFNNLS